MNWRDTFEPLKVTAWLRTGVIADEYLPLDAIIRYQAFRNAYGHQDYSLPGGDFNTPNLPPCSMPLAKRERDGVWYYACSFARPQPWWIGEYQDHWNKRFDASLADLIDFAGRRGAVNIKSAKYRAYHMPVFYRVAQKIEWYCVGDLSMIGSLLSTCTGLGKKIVQGWGRVIKWEVERCKNDWSEFMEGMPTRALPAKSLLDETRGSGSAFKVKYYGVRPPYYAKSTQMLCVMP